MEHLAELVTAVLASRRASPADDSFMSNADALGAEQERDVIAKSEHYYYYYYYTQRLAWRKAPTQELLF